MTGQSGSEDVGSTNQSQLHLLSFYGLTMPSTRVLLQKGFESIQMQNTVFLWEMIMSENGN
jgi:hypothetical protein